MAKAYKVKINNNTYVRLQDTAFGRKIQYLINLDKFSAKQWVGPYGAWLRWWGRELREEALYNIFNYKSNYIFSIL
ncbi:MAG: hypothetical protein LBU89_08345 [Fibromonadaceae bacterium]|jgi:hypothetical protein|nr:hypothetical protein [Fibromonadaceae bacterium]